MVPMSASSAAIGPSPRVRGELDDQPTADHQLRAIPACAGRTPHRRDDAAAIRTGHPRVCGENAPARCRSCTHRRAIPACAGRTEGWLRGPPPDCGPSPRVRGERLLLTPQLEPSVGPSPRVRGEHRCDRFHDRVQAGHPRVCGENIRPTTATTSWSAGHPRVCGENDRHDHLLAANERAIPACAGRTAIRPEHLGAAYGPSPRVRGERGQRHHRTASMPGHPRVCGENECHRGPQGFLAGPSPRVRGERPRFPSAYPAPAGHPRVCGENRTDPPDWLCPWPGHPRVCGENSGDRFITDYLSRAIPACAGRTRCARLACVVLVGPSPRVRGERPKTCVGCRSRPGHPRVCGENGVPRTADPGDPGPSPRVRGERSHAPRLRVRWFGPSPRVRGEPSDGVATLTL